MTFHALLVLKGNMHNPTDKKDHVRKQSLQLIQMTVDRWKLCPLNQDIL